MKGSLHVSPSLSAGLEEQWDSLVFCELFSWNTQAPAEYLAMRRAAAHLLVAAHAPALCTTQRNKREREAGGRGRSHRKHSYLRKGIRRFLVVAVDTRA